MHLNSIHKQILKAMLVALFVLTASRAFSQVVPAVKGGTRFPLAVGAGYSNFDLDFGYDASGERRMSGLGVWVDWNRIPFTPKVLNGLGIEVEGHDINYGRPVALSRMRQDSFGAGPIYTYHHFNNFRPFAKFLIGVGSIDFPPLPGAPLPYTHDTRTIFAPGGGLEYRAFKNIWVRGEYEYQYWPKLFGPHTLNPNGLTVGAMYDFGGGKK